MTPNRKITINGHLVKEFYWAGTYVTYINNRSTSETYDEAVDRINREAVDRINRETNNNENSVHQ